MKIWDPHLRSPATEIRKKVAVYNSYGVKVQPGGIFMEIARIQGSEAKVMERLAAMGFSVIEVSDTATSGQRDMKREADFVKRARDLGFTVFGEVGKKFAEADSTRTNEDVVNEEVTINEMLALFEAGASYVYWEGHLLRRLKLPFDSVRDVAPISPIASTPSVVVVTASLPVRSVKDLIALAKAKPGQISFASAGSGTSHHLGGEPLQVKRPQMRKRRR